MVIIRFQEIIENESRSTTWVDPKTVFEPHIEPKNISLGPKKSKKSPKIKWKSNVRMKERKKIKVVALFE